MQPIERVQFRDPHWFESAVARKIETSSAIGFGVSRINCVHINGQLADVIEFADPTDQKGLTCNFFGVNSNDGA